jgi:bacterioferritin-associated ferredoxin
MLVCHCNGVSDRTIRRVVRDGARSVGQVADACGAGSCCGGCHREIRKIVRAEGRAERDPASVAMPAESVAAGA